MEGRFTVTRAAVVARPGKMAGATIVPFGDVHRYSAGCDVALWRQWCREQREACRRDCTVRYIGMGDNDDMLSRRERDAYWRVGFHGATHDELDRYVQAKIDGFAREISFMRGRLLGMLAGNHWWQFADGTTSHTRLCAAMECPDLGDVAYVSVTLRRSTLSRPHSQDGHVDIVAHHGRAGGKLAGTTISHVHDMTRIFPSAHVYIMGHDHQRGAWPVPGRLRCEWCKLAREMRVHEVPGYLVRSGSFLRAYVPGQSSYVAAALKAPANLGTVAVHARLISRSCNQRRRTLVLSASI